MSKTLDKQTLEHLRISRVISMGETRVFIMDTIAHTIALHKRGLESPGDGNSIIRYRHEQDSVTRVNLWSAPGVTA